MKSYYLALLLLVITGAGCKNLQDPEFRRVENFRVKKLGFEKSSLGFSVTYYNPNNFGVVMKQASLDIYLDSVYLGNFTQDSAISVNRKAEFSIPLTGEVLMKTALELNIQNMADRDIPFKAEGKVKVGKAGIFVTKPVFYQGTHRLDEIKF